MKPNHSRYLLSVVRFFVILIGTIALLGCDSPDEAATGDAPGDANAKSVVLFQYAGSPLYDHGVSGVVEGLKEKGYVEGKNLKLTRQNADASPESAVKIAREIGDGDFDLVVATGTQALQAVAKADPAGETPIVFGMVANPFRAGVGLHPAFPKSGPGHITGVGSFPPVVPAIRLAKQLNPELKVIGIVFNPTEAQAQESVEQARSVTEELGIELLGVPAGNGGEVGAAAKALVGSGAQILLIGADNTVHNAAAALIAAGREGGVPVMSSLPGDAKRGALFDLSHDWQKVGKDVGEIGGDILSGTDPSTIAVVVSPDRLKLVLNEAALQGLNGPWSFPEAVVAQADEVVTVGN